MKKYIFLAIFPFMLPFFSFADRNFSDYIWADKWWALENIYANTYKYYEENINQSSDKAIWEITSKLWINRLYIKNVLDGNLTICAKFFDKLNIDVKNWATKEDFQSCYNKISSMYNNYIQASLTNKQLQSSLSVENLLTDGKKSNSPYDLLIDIQDIWDLLFKKKVEIHFWKVLIWSDSNWWDNNNPKYNWLIPYDNTIADNNPSNSNTENSTNTNNPADNTNESTPINEITNTNSQTQQNQVNTNNSNLQLWNMCLNQANDNNFVNNKTVSDDTTNNDWFWNANNPNDLNDTNNWWNNNFNNISFDTFIWENIHWWDFDLWGISLSWLNNNTNLKSDLWWWSKLCVWKDQLLTICIKFVPSWPRWSVWWTVSKNTLEWIIEQISNTLKDIRQSFIIPAWHGDEALDIDFMHIKLADIFAFNIILSKKPVFKFEKNEKAEKEKNKADTQSCPWVPRKLSKLYNETSLAYCNNKDWDKNKYLITNLDNINIKNKEPSKFIKPTEKVVSNSSKGSYKEIELYTQYNKNLLNFMTNLKWLMKNWANASAWLKAKSE